jgi:D-beta-D-heptose 7-phosphate kinase/D-beta-D-heptose 1-phosphate adenosyltransferase
MPFTYDLLHRLEKLPSNHIVVVGDVMLDRFMYGQVDRISPEAPVPVMRYVREISMLGGAGNVVRNLISLGQKSEMIGVIGNDAAGFEIGKQLAQYSTVTPHLLTDQNRATTVKTRFVAGIQQVLRCDIENDDALPHALEEQVEMRLRMAAAHASAIILSDYAKGVLTPKIIRCAIELAKQYGKPLIVDPKVRDYALYEGADVITPNRKELAEAAGQPIRTVEEAIEASQDLIRRFNFGAVLAKLGGDGVCLVRPGQEAEHFKATAREVYDVSGAGDTVIAAFATALAAGMPIEFAARLANEAGSVVVGKVGTATVTAEELIRAMRDFENHEMDEKVQSQNKAMETVERWRRQGLNVGFTNGCFDLLHPGHISLLQQARGACDRLVVGLNTDASVKRLKGPERPVQNEKARAMVMASLAAVDLVVLFDEDTPLELINMLRPAVLVKGADYTIDKVVGAPEVQSWGGKVFLAELVDGQSTTGTIKKMRALGS